MMVMRLRGTKNETRMRSKKPKGENAFETAKMSLCTLTLTLALALTLTLTLHGRAPLDRVPSCRPAARRVARAEMASCRTRGRW